MSGDQETIKSKCKICTKLIYNNGTTCCTCHNNFHIRCTQYKTKDFYKLKANTNYNFQCIYCELYKCGKCSKAVFDNDNAVQCDCSDCKKWFHLRCSPFSKTQYSTIQNGHTLHTWICQICYKFPFSAVTNENLHKLFTITDKLEQHTFKQLEKSDHFYDICSICNRKHTKNKTNKGILCNLCKHIVHRKCSGIPLNELLLNKASILENWACMTCMKDMLPFTSLEQDDLFKLTFNSNVNCRCKVSSNSISRDNRFRFTKILENSNHNFGPDPDNILVESLELKPIFDYYTPHEFHKLIQKLPNAPKRFSLLHSNIH